MVPCCDGGARYVQPGTDRGLWLSSSKGHQGHIVFVSFRSSLDFSTCCNCSRRSEYEISRIFAPR